jgi:UPF0755 protein
MMKTAQRIFKWFAFLVLILGVLGASAWKGWDWWNWASSPPASAAPEPQQTKAEPLEVAIPQGTSAQQIGQDLQARGLIRSSAAWDLWTRWLMLQDPEGGFQAGTYVLSPDQSLQAIADIIWQGKVVSYSFTIPEGYSLRQMAAYFEQQGFFKAQDFLAVASQVPYGKYPWLPQGIPHLEGFLYPDTYQLATKQVSPQEVVDRMLDRFEQVALPLYTQNQSKTDLSLLEWATLASIIEKEAVVPTERSTIAGVFTNRLQKGIPLGADPTVEYGLGVQQTPDNPLTLDQVRTPSAYNTYINPGLPPTPIASAGLASLQATLTPEDTPYLYFVARYDGTHIFSRTLAEHEAAQAAIRAKQDQKKPSPVPTSTAKPQASTKPPVKQAPKPKPEPAKTTKPNS